MLPYRGSCFRDMCQAGGTDVFVTINDYTASFSSYASGQCHSFTSDIPTVLNLFDDFCTQIILSPNANPTETSSQGTVSSLCIELSF